MGSGKNISYIVEPKSYVMVTCFSMGGRHRTRSRRKLIRPTYGPPDWAAGTRYGAAYYGWRVTLYTVVIIIAPYAGWALVVLASRGVIPHILHVLP